MYKFIDCFGHNKDKITPLKDTDQSEHKFLYENLYLHKANYDSETYAEYYFLDINANNIEEFRSKYSSLSYHGMLDIQNAILRKYYYQLGSDLRWNLYLYFVFETEDLMNQLEDVFRIQQEATFAHKNIISRKEIDTIPIFFNFKELTEKMKNNQTNEMDLEVEWEEKFNDLNLTEYINSDRATLDIDNYLLNLKKINTNSKGKKNTKKANDKNINYINKIYMQNYRLCFGNEKYSLDFGKKINTFYGTNGAGKTSILEAIEYGITGDNHRVATNSLSSPSVSVLNDANQIYSSSIQNTEKQHLDIHWYNGRRAYTSTLNANFCKFNFFDSDNTKLLKAKKGNKEIIDSLESIIYTSDMKHKKARLEKLKEIFQNKKQELLTQLKEIESSIKKQIARKIEIENNTVGKQIREEFTRKSKIINDCNSIDEIGKTIIEVKSLLESALLNREHYLIDNLHKLKHFAESKNIIIANAETKLKEIEKLEKELKYLQSAITKEDEQIKKIYKIENWFLNTDNVFVVDYKNELEITQKIKAFLIRILDKTSELKLDAELKCLLISDLSSQIAAATATKSKLELAIKANQEKIAKQDDEIEIASTAITKTDKIDNDLREIINQKLELRELETTCPVCGHDHEVREKLLNAINDNFAVKKSLSESYQKLLREQKILKDDLVKEQQKLKKAEEKSTALKSLLEIVEEYSTTINVQGIDSFTVEHFINILSVKHNEYVIAFSKLEKAQDIYNLIESCNLQSIDSNELKSKINIAKTKYNNTKKDFIITQDNIKNKLIETGTKENLQKIINEHKIELNNLHDLIKVISEIFQKTKFDKNKSLQEIRGELNALFAEYEKVQQYSFVLKELENIIVELEKLKKIKELSVKPKLDNAEIVLTELNNLKTTEENTKEFVKKHKDNIEALFRLIHKPREFSNMGISKNGEISFTRKTPNGNDEDNANPEHMSTGQQVSLALAIIFTLHFSAPNAPRFIMLDEPIANLDDVHFVNMLDILRAIAISGTQIFVSTANQDIAGMMRRKFSVFSSDYAHFVLMREENKPTSIYKKTYTVSQEESVVAKVC